MNRFCSRPVAGEHRLHLRLRMGIDGSANGEFERVPAAAGSIVGSVAKYQGNGASRHGAAECDQWLARTEGHSDGDREYDERRVFRVLNDGAEPYDGQCADEAEGQRDVLADHLRDHRDQHAEHRQGAGKRSGDSPAAAASAIDRRDDESKGDGRGEPHGECHGRRLGRGNVEHPIGDTVHLPTKSTS